MLNRLVTRALFIVISSYGSLCAVLRVSIKIKIEITNATSKPNNFRARDWVLANRKKCVSSKLLVSAASSRMLSCTAGAEQLRRFRRLTYTCEPDLKFLVLEEIGRIARRYLIARKYVDFALYSLFVVYH